jgi:hypothetical protein
MFERPPTQGIGRKGTILGESPRMIRFLVAPLGVEMGRAIPSRQERGAPPPKFIRVGRMAVCGADDALIRHRSMEPGPSGTAVNLSCRAPSGLITGVGRRPPVVDKWARPLASSPKAERSGPPPCFCRSSRTHLPGGNPPGAQGSPDDRRDCRGCLVCSPRG